MSHESMDYEGVLHAAGHRVTPQREMILDAVCDGGGHTTLKQVYTRVKHMDDTIDLSSVYRTLKLFLDLGLVVSAETPAGETVYEIPKPRPHHHLVCRVCGKEEEVGQEAVADTVAFVYRHYGFRVDAEHLVLTGLCRECQQTGAASDRAARWLSRAVQDETQERKVARGGGRIATQGKEWGSKGEGIEGDLLSRENERVHDTQEYGASER